MVCLFLATTTPAAFGADQSGNFAVRGFGSARCQDYEAAARENNSEALLAYASWLQGYFSARNQMAVGTFDTVPIYQATELLTLLRSVCARSENLLVENAASEIIDLFEAAYTSEPSEVLTLERDGARATIRSATLTQVQQRLRDLGYYDSAVDGVFGDRSATAIERFQAQAGLPETGLPDLATLVELFIE